MPLSPDGLDGSTSPRPAPPPEKSKETRGRIKSERADGRVPLSQLTGNVSLTPPEEISSSMYTLIKTVINKAACCKGGGSRLKKKKSFWGGVWGMLPLPPWRFSVMSQFDGDG